MFLFSLIEVFFLIIRYPGMLMYIDHCMQMVFDLLLTVIEEYEQAGIFDSIQLQVYFLGSGSGITT